MKRLFLSLMVLTLLSFPLVAAAQGEVVWQNQPSENTDNGGYGDLGGVTVASDGTIYVADGFLGIRVLASDGTLQETLTHPDVSSADDVVWASNGTLWVADSLNNRVYHLDTDGTLLNWFGERGSGGGQFGELSPSEIDIAPNGNLYVFDSQEDNNGDLTGRIQVFDGDGNYLREFSTDPDGSGAGAFIRMTVDSQGNIYAADFFGGLIVFDPNGKVLADNLLQDEMQYASIDALTLNDQFIYIAVDGEIVQLSRRGDVLGAMGSAQSANRDNERFSSGEFGEVRGMDILPNGDVIVSSTNYTWSQIVRLHFS